MKKGFFQAFLEEIKKKNLTTDLINVVLGILMMVMIVLFIIFPGNGVILALLFVVAGLMNLQTGLRNYRDKKKRTSAMCFVMLGAVILILGTMLLIKMAGQ